MGLQRHRTRLPSAILSSGSLWSTLPTFVSDTLPSFYLELQPSDDLCIPSYCDNFNMLKTRKPRDIDSSSWYTNTDNDVYMIRSALRIKLPIPFTSLHVRAHQDKNCEFELLPRPKQFNVLADRLATEVLEDLRAADNLLSSTRYPPAAPIFGMAQGTSQAGGKAQLTNEFPEFESRAYIQKRNNWTDQIFDSINWTAYRAALSALTDNVGSFVIKLSHNWATSWRTGTPMRRCD
jgi:hypothetical protein